MVIRKIQSVTSLILLSAGLSFCFLTDASAHARWALDGVTPPRNTNAGIKTGPCGGVPRTATPATFAPGETITVTWEETIDHQGYFIISFSEADDVGFEQNILKTGAELPDDQNGTPLPHKFSTTVTLPAIECDACTLQLIQYMERSMSNYYSCADIKLVAGGGNGDGGGNDGGEPIDDGSGDNGNVQRSLTEIANILLRDFEELDVSNDNMLAFDEVESSTGITQAQFTELDKNAVDGFLTVEELEAALAEEEESGSIGFFALLLLAMRRRQVNH